MILAKSILLKIPINIAIPAVIINILYDLPFNITDLN
jgi:hypothetical protein